MRIKNVLAGVLIVLVVYLFTPVGAQTIVRLYGTVSGAPIALLATSGGLLRVSVDGGVTPTYPLAVTASTCAAPGLGESGAVTTGIAFTATPSILNCISGTAVTTLTAAAGLVITHPTAQTGLTLQGNRPTLSFNDSTGVLGGSIDLGQDPLSTGFGLEFRSTGVTGLAGVSNNWQTFRFNGSANKVYIGDTGLISWIQAGHNLQFAVGSGIGSTPDVTASPQLTLSPTVFTSTIPSDTPVLALAGNKALRSGTPTVTGAGSTCGTSAPAIVGNNSFGKVTTGSVAPTSCVVTFSSTWNTAPACIAANETTSNLLRATSTATTLTLAGTMVAGDTLVFVCGGYVP